MRVVRRRTVLQAVGLQAVGLQAVGLGSAGALLGLAAQARPPDALVRWYVGEPGGRTNPFVTWTVETTWARFGLCVRPTHDCDAADVLTIAASGCRTSCVTVAERANNPEGASALAGFLASPQARAHALRLAAGS